MDNASVDAASQIILLAGGAGCIAGLLIGYIWFGHRPTKSRELISEEEVPQLFPTSDPREWDHLPVSEKEQAL